MLLSMYFHEVALLQQIMQESKLITFSGADFLVHETLTTTLRQLSKYLQLSRYDFKANMNKTVEY